MKNERSLKPWQIIVIVIAVGFMFAPIIWDVLVGSFTVLADIRLDQIFTREGFFIVGLLMLIGVGGYELVRDYDDKPKSDYTR